MHLTPGERRATQRLISGIKGAIEAAVPDCTVSLYGSRATGLEEPLSDINMSVVSSEHKMVLEKRRSNTSHPTALAAKSRTAAMLLRLFNQKARFSQPCVIDSEVPSMKLHDQLTGLSITLNCDDIEYSRPRDFTICLLEESPQVRPLLLVLRHALAIRGLHESHRGGTGTYPLLLMILVALSSSKTKFRRDELAGQLLHVLRFWGAADVANDGFAADPPRIFAKYQRKPKNMLHAEDDTTVDSFLAGTEFIAHRNWATSRGLGMGRKYKHNPNFLCLQDPLNPSCDVGKDVRRIDDIQKLFRHWDREIRLSMDAWDRSPENLVAPEERKHQYILSPLLRCDHLPLIAARKHLAAAAYIGDSKFS